MSSEFNLPQLETLMVEQCGHVARICLNRAEKANAMNAQMWQDIRTAMQWADACGPIRAVVLRGQGKHFTSGIDLTMMMGLMPQIQDACDGRVREKLRRLILDMQDTLSSLERCRKPVLASVHGACIGGGVDLICCADMRYASAEASFSIKEVDIGMVADVGTLQRLPKLIADGVARELAYTGRRIDAQEAQSIGLVNRVFASPEELDAQVMAIAQTIAAKSPLSIRGIKEMLNYSRDHSVSDGLNFIATWNAAMLMSEDLQAAMAASMSKQTPQFRD